MLFLSLPLLAADWSSAMVSGDCTGVVATLVSPTVPIERLVLARCLEAHGDVEQALARYEALRLERTTKIVNGSAESGRRFHNPTLADPDAAPSA